MDRDLVFLLVLLVCNHLPAFSSRMVPVHDSMYAFQIYYQNYNELVATGNVARWLPYGMYGVPAAFDQIICLSPMCYLVGLVGAVAGVRDVLWLFKITLLCEQAVCLLGLYLLAKTIYSSRLSRLLVCATVIVTGTWFTQLWWDWRIYYLLPLTFHFIIQFATREKPLYLWAAAITALCSLLGSLIYFSPLLLFILVIVSGCILLKKPSVLLLVVRPSWANLLGGLTFLACAAVYAWQVLHCLDDVTLIVFGRDPVSGKVPLDIFLVYGGMVDRRVIMSFLTGWPAHGDNTYYIGLLPLVCVAWGVLTVRSRVFWAFTVAAAALILLSLGGTAARIIYHFPMMSLFRHIGLVYGPIKLLLILASGFGLDSAVSWVVAAQKAAASRRSLSTAGNGLGASWSYRSPGKRWTAQEARSFLKRAVLVLAGAAVVALLIRKGVVINPWRALRTHVEQGSPVTHPRMALIFVFGRIALYCGLARVLFAVTRRGLGGHPSWRALTTTSLFVAVAADIGSYRYMLHDGMPRLAILPPSERQLFRSHPLHFCERRLDMPEDDATIKGLRLYKTLPPRPGHAKYAMAYNFLGFDPLSPKFKTDMLSKRAAALVCARGGEPKQVPDDEFLPDCDDWLDAALGCSCPKARLITDPLFVSGTDQQVLQVIQKLPADSTSVVLPAQPEALPATAPSEGDTEPAAQVEVVQFSANTLVCKTVVPPGKPRWLYYADSWHPAWRCSVNGQPAQVVQANYAFKAVRLTPGEATVRFTFDGGACVVSSSALALIGLLFALGILVYVAWSLLVATPDRQAFAQEENRHELRQMGSLRRLTRSLPHFSR